MSTNELALIRNADFSAAELTSVLCPFKSGLVSIPGYDSIREVYRGGQGIVYRAVQTKTGRNVAVKVLRDGPFQGFRDRMRFDREIRILGRLQHPNIVTIHDRGTVEDNHYFVMDFIPGCPLDAFVSANGCSIHEIVRLMKKISLAVHAAHVRGVIHRDLKPGNIRIDPSGEPYILDFGLAKVSTFGESSSDPTMTATGQFLGTVHWASPEQLIGAADDVDLRTDVYALGVILYQLLTNRFPFPAGRNLLDGMNHIVKGDLIPPRLVRGDLAEDVELIVLKCLERLPELRYQSAAEMAEDLQRFLDRRPIQARPPSTMYQARRLIARHPWPTALVASLALVVTAFSIWMGVLYARAGGERNRAVQAEIDATQRKSQAEREAKTSKAVTDFLVHDLLASAAPETSRGRNITVQEALENASLRIRSAFDEEPLVRASVLFTVGQVYQKLGLYQDAKSYLQDAESIWTASSGTADPDTLRVRIQLADVFLKLGAYRDGESLAAATYKGLIETLGGDHAETLRAAEVLAQAKWHLGKTAEARALAQKIYERQRIILGESHADSLHSLGQWALWRFLDFVPAKESELKFRSGLDAAVSQLGVDHPDTLRLKTSLGACLMRQRQFAEADSLLLGSLAKNREILGEDHPDTIATMVHVAAMRQQQGFLDEAESVIRRAEVLARQNLGDLNPLTFWVLERLVDIVADHGEPGEALQIQLALNESRRLAWGDSDEVVLSLGNVGTMLFNMGRFKEAVDVLTIVVQKMRDMQISGRGLVGNLRGLTSALEAVGDEQSARPIALELLAIREQIASATDPDPYMINAYARDLLEAYPTDLRNPSKALEMALRAFKVSPEEYHYNRFTLGLAYEANGMLDEAAAMLQRALAHAPIEVGGSRNLYESALIRVLETKGDLVAAEEYCRETLTKRRQTFEYPHTDIALSLEVLGAFMLRHDRPHDAEICLRESLDIRSVLDPSHWMRGVTLIQLVRALSDQNRHDDAEAILIQGVSLLEKNINSPRKELLKAYSATDQFYQSIGREDLARHYSELAREPQ